MVDVMLTVTLSWLCAKRLVDLIINIYDSFDDDHDDHDCDDDNIIMMIVIHVVMVAPDSEGLVL